MDPIKSSLNKWMNQNEWRNRYNTLRDEVLKDPRILEFKAKHPDLTNGDLERNMMKLFEYKRERDHCDACPGLDLCPNMMQGYQPELTGSGREWSVAYHKCSLKIKHDERVKHRRLIKSLYIPTEVVEATFDDIELDNSSRSEAARKAIEFVEGAAPGENAKGLYFHGKFGVGKSFIMGAVANALAKRNISTIIVYAPDFFREMKEALSTGTTQEKIDSIKKVDVLILDDIGAETTSAWIRDDVLGVILQYRMMEKLPTLYTSNYNYKELENHLAYSQRGGTEDMKATRIMERIKHLTEAVHVDGDNKRSS